MMHPAVTRRPVSEVEAFRIAPTEDGQGEIVRLLGSAKRNLASLDMPATAETSQRLAKLKAGVQALSQDAEAMLAAQRALGYGDSPGLTTALHASLDALDEAAISELDYADPLQAGIGDSYRAMRIGEFKFAASRSDDDRDSFLKAADALGRAADGSFMGPDKKQAIADAVNTVVLRFNDWSSAVQTSSAAAARAAQHSLLTTNLANEAVEAAANASQATQIGLIAAQRDTTRLIAATIVAIVLVCGTLCLVVGRSISRPISRLAEIMHRMAGGDLHATISERPGRDEIARMTAAVIGFKQAGLAKLRLETEAAAAQQAM